MSFENLYMFDYLNQKGELKFQPVIHPEDLMLNTPFKIYGFEKFNTQYGPTVVARLEHGKLFLPRRLIDELTQEVCKALLSGNGGFLIYKGLKLSGYARPANTYVFGKYSYVSKSPEVLRRES